MFNNISAADLSRLLKKFPEFLRASDLIELGLYKGRADVTVAKKKGDCPPFIKISSHKFLFPKTSLVSWLMGKCPNNNSKTEE